jgi:hypothetical protein
MKGMRGAWIFSVVMVAVATLAIALSLWNPYPVHTEPIPGERYVVIGDEELGVSIIAKKFTSSVSPQATHARVFIEGGVVRFRSYGTAAAKSGATMIAGGMYEVNENSELMTWNVALDSTTSTAPNSVTAYVIYYGRS